MNRTWVVLITLAFLLVCLGWAEDDEPGRGVARISLINGDVSVRRGDSGDWVAAAVNAPLVAYDHVLTGVNSRAEVQFDWANMVRLASNTEIRIAELENRRYQVQLSRGTVMLRVLRDSQAEIEVNTPSVSVRPDRKGAYRITVTDDGQSEITARSGEAEVYTPNGVERLRSGRTMLVRGTSTNPEFQTVSAIARDGWDRWNEDRDQRLERTRSYQYVSRDIYGADDLDYHGRWINVPPYGWVWSPYGVGPYWAPYQYGRWVWVDWYGWSWLSYDPWGWAPFHYGRWFWGRPYGWCWYPGPIYHRYYWRPALVAFFGFGVGHGTHVGIGFGFGRIGWVPLAPYEPFYPWYGRRYYGGFRQHTYVDNSVRIVNNINITNVYRNARVVNAVSGVDTGGFVRGGRIQPIRTTDAEFRRANLVQGQVPVAPAAESVRFADRQVRVANLPRTDNTRFFSRRQPAAVERVPFDDQRRGMEQVVRRTFGSPGQAENAGSVRASQGMPRAETGNAPRTESGNLPRAGNADEQRGWRRTGEPARAETGNLPRTRDDVGGAGTWRRIGETPRTDSGNMPRTATQPGNRSEWRRFGEPVDRSQTGDMPRTVEREGRTRISGRDDATGARSSEDNRNWRRFGDSSREGEAGRATPRLDRQDRQAPDSRGASPQESRPIPRRSEEGADRGQGSVRRQSDDVWQRFSGGTASPRMATPAEPSRRDDSVRWGAPRFERRAGSEPRSESPRYEAPRSERHGASQPIFINPPIVRERSSPRIESRGGHDSGGGRAGGEMRGGGEGRGGGTSRSEGASRGGGRMGRER